LQIADFSTPVGRREAGYLQSVRRGWRSGTQTSQSWLARLAMADFLFAAWLAWRTPLLAALSSFLAASRCNSMALSLSPASAASRNLRIAVFTEDLTDWLRRRAFSLVLMRLIWDLMLATRALLDHSGEFRCRVVVAPASG